MIRSPDGPGIFSPSLLPPRSLPSFFPRVWLASPSRYLYFRPFYRLGPHALWPRPTPLLPILPAAGRPCQMGGGIALSRPAKGDGIASLLPAAWGPGRWRQAGVGRHDPPAVLLLSDCKPALPRLYIYTWGGGRSYPTGQHPKLPKMAVAPDAATTSRCIGTLSHGPRPRAPGKAPNPAKSKPPTRPFHSESPITEPRRMGHLKSRGPTGGAYRAPKYRYLRWLGNIEHPVRRCDNLRLPPAVETAPGR